MELEPGATQEPLFLQTGKTGSRLGPGPRLDPGTASVKTGSVNAATKPFPCRMRAATLDGGTNSGAGLTRPAAELLGTLLFSDALVATSINFVRFVQRVPTNSAQN